MGCDIHVYTEKLNSQEHWVNVDLWKLNQYYSPYIQPGTQEQQWTIHSVYSGRDYELFSALADVRSSYGDTAVFSEPRGLPDDVSDIVRAQNDRWSSDAHSHSYATLQELENWVEQQPSIPVSGWVTNQNAHIVDSGGIPTEYYAEGGLNYESDRSELVWRRWNQPYSVLADFLEAATRRCRDEFWVGEATLLSDQQKSRFRVVFWFDN